MISSHLRNGNHTMISSLPLQLRIFLPLMSNHFFSVKEIAHRSKGTPSKLTLFENVHGFRFKFDFLENLEHIAFIDSNAFITHHNANDVTFISAK
jgi:hypothetical protein